MSADTRQTDPAPGHRTLVRQLVRFNLVGVLNTAVDFILFFLLNACGVPYLLAQSCSYGCGIANSYLCNRRWTFGLGGASLAEALRFLGVSSGCLLLSVLLVHLIHARLDVPLVPAKIGATLLTMLAGFFANRAWVFKAAPVRPVGQEGG